MTAFLLRLCQARQDSSRSANVLEVMSREIGGKLKSCAGARLGLSEAVKDFPG